MALQRVTMGFAAGQVLAVRVEDAALDEPLEALAGGGWHDVALDDGTMRLNLAQVVYVRTERDEHRVGFGVG